MGQDNDCAMYRSDAAKRRVVGCYFLVAGPAHLLWEFSHMPLYTLWEAGTRAEIAFAAIHCTGGDLLIAAGALALGVVLFEGRVWPDQRYVAVAAATIAFGLVYTIFSEWLNIEIRQSWAYREAMPSLPGLAMGLTPLLQWLIVPALALWLAGREFVVRDQQNTMRSGPRS